MNPLDGQETNTCLFERHFLGNWTRKKEGEVASILTGKVSVMAVNENLESGSGE
jgi:hypothetical protein